ncbi:hypothetical protein ES706_04887 [subsurface metagenome]
MNGKGHALARDELIRVLTAYSGVTTENGNIGGTTLIDANLKDNPSISEHAIKEKTILIMSGDAIMEDKGAASFVNATGTITLQGTGFSAQIKAGTTYRILNISSVEIDVADIDTKIGTNTDPAGTSTLFAWLAKIFAADVLGLTTFTQETHVAVNANGTNWVDLLDKSTITKPTKICGFKVTVSAGWTGKARVRITDGAGTTKIFPFQAYYEQDDGFTSGTQVVFNFLVVVPVADGYKLQFCSSNGADGAGNTVTLDNLDVIEVG